MVSFRNVLIATCPDSSYHLNLIHSRTFGGSGTDIFYDCMIRPNGTVLAVGYSGSLDGNITDPLGSADGWAVLLSSELELIWTRNLGGSLIDQLEGVCATPDDAAAMVGYSVSSDGDLTHNNGESDVWVLKFEAWDETGLNETNHPPFTLFPNPTTNTLQVQWAGPAPQAFEVLDITGRLVYGPVVPTRSGKEGYELSVAGWTPGLYTLRMHSTAGPVIQRFVKE